jgi:hypothetical protein
MTKHHNAQGKQRNNIGKRVSTLEREVKEMRAKTPIPPEQRMNMAAMSREARPGEKMDFMRVKPGNASYDETVADHISRLKGRSVSHVADDRTRGARSPLDETDRRRRR